jgi:Xaa-Pro aminopeptidase
LDANVKGYLHSNGITILEYEQIWSSLEAWGKRVTEERRASGSEGVGKETLGEKGEKIVSTDKVLVGTKTSWAVTVALGEVCLILAGLS